MNSLFFAIFAGCCASLSSLSFRKSTENGQSVNSFLILYYLISFLLCFVFFPELLIANINYIILIIGACVGIFNSILMFVTSKALQNGPPGLTFAFLNASAVFPGVILYLLLGNQFDFSYSVLQSCGLILVILGLFYGAKNELSCQTSRSLKWLKYALISFFIQIVALTFIQARCILFTYNDLIEIFLNYRFSEIDDIWFMPGLFGTSFIIQLLLYVRNKQHFSIKGFYWGSLGGLTNFSSTLLLLLATKFSYSYEKMIIFPCFAVVSMLLSNLWANKLYNENFNIRANTLCSTGIFLAVSS